MRRFVGCLGLAVLVPGMVMADPMPVGEVYTIPAMEYLDAPHPESGMDATTVSVDLFMYDREDDVPVAQLIATVGDHTSGIMLHREDVPTSAARLFGSVESMWVSFRARVRGGNNRYQMVTDLLDDSGEVVGDHIRLLDATGEPVEDMRVTYTGLLAERFPQPGRSQDGGPYYMRFEDSRKSVGAARLSEDGDFVVPRPSFARSHNRMGNIQFGDMRVTDSGSGTQYSLASAGSGREHSYTSITVPFLNDWSTSVPGLEKFEGQIFHDDGSPAGGVEFQVLQPARVDEKGQPLQGSYGGYRLFTTGPDGKFRFAFKFPASSRVGHHGASVATLVVKDEKLTGHHQLKPNEFNEIRTRKTRTLHIELVDESGAPLDLSTTPTVAGDWVWGYQMAGTISTHQSSGAGEFAIIKLDEDGQIQPVTLAVPGEYRVRARQFVFEPKMISEGDKYVRFQAINKSVDVKARIVDLEGQPVAGAFLGVNRSVVGVGLTSFTLELLRKVYERQQGGETFVDLVMGRADSDGVVSFRVQNVVRNAGLYVTAEGYGVERVILAEQDPGGELHEGVLDLGDVKLAREAKLKVKLRVPDDDATSGILAGRGIASWYTMLLAEFLGNSSAEAARGKDVYVNWLTDEDDPRKVERVVPGMVMDREYSVPAGTTFTLVVAADFDTTGTRKLEVTEPLAPGEVRDLGVVEVNEPVE